MGLCPAEALVRSLGAGGASSGGHLTFNKGLEKAILAATGIGVAGGAAGAGVKAATKDDD
jgi:hypothetical protein